LGEALFFGKSWERQKNQGIDGKEKSENGVIIRFFLYIWTFQ
jgi:hypothetical protein